MEQKFEYTYSSPRKAEIEKIRKKYTPKTTCESKLEEMRRLDRSVEMTGMVRSLSVGIFGSLVLGVGMCCTMVWTNLFVIGIFIGIAGMLLCGCAYPLYKNTVKKKREQIASQILELANEIETGI